MRSYLLMVLAPEHSFAPTGPAGQEPHFETTDAHPGVFFSTEMIDRVHADPAELPPDELSSSRARAQRVLGIMGVLGDG